MLSTSEAAARQEMYQFFSSLLLKEPEEELIQQLQETVPHLKEAFAHVASLGNWEKMTDHYQAGQLTISDVKQDFYDLFFVPVSGKYSPAIESVLIENSLWGEVERELASRYDNAKFIPEQLNIYTPFKQLGMSDLLGYELAFMAHLCTMETFSSMEIRQRVQQEEFEMLNGHILPFVQRYIKENKDSLEGTLYGPLLDLINDFIINDSQLLKEEGVILNA